MYALEVASKGEHVVPRELLKALARTEASVNPDVLTPRQREVLELVAEGLSNAQIARRLFLTEFNRQAASEQGLQAPRGAQPEPGCELPPQEHLTRWLSWPDQTLAKTLVGLAVRIAAKVTAYPCWLPDTGLSSKEDKGCEYNPDTTHLGIANGRGIAR